MDISAQQPLPATFGSDLKATLRALRRKAWLIALCTLAAGFLGALYAYRSPKIYSSQAIIQIEQEEQRVLKIEKLASDDLKTQEVLSTIEQNLTSPELLLRVIEVNNLNKSSAFLPELRRPVSSGDMQEALARHISSKVRRGTRLIDIKVEERSPGMAQQVAQMLLREFERQGIEARTENLKLAHDFLLREADRLKDKLASSEETLQSYREASKTLSLADKQNITVEKLKDLNLKVTEAKATRLKLESDNALVAQLSDKSPRGLLAIPSVATSAPVLEMKKTIGDRQGQLAILAQRYKPEHPRYAAAQSELDELIAGLDQAAIKGAQMLSTQYQGAVDTERKLEQALTDLEKAALELTRISIPYNVLNRDVESDRVLYESVLARLKEIDLTRGVTQTPFRIVARPQLPQRPVRPNKLQILELSIFGGLALGIGLTLLSMLMDGSCRTADEAERRLGIPALAIIPKCREMTASTDGSLLIKHPDSAAAEAFRGLRTSLTLLGKTDPARRMFLFTSAIPSEGKSSCAINCATAFAQQGLKTLLIDADLRLPVIGRNFFPDQPLLGLADILAGTKGLDETARATGIENLFLLCAGSRAMAPAELLARDSLGMLLKQASNTYDRIVIDSAPIHSVADTLLLACHADAVCLVISATHTPADAVLRALRKLATAASKPVGFVFNRVSLRRGLDYYDNRYSLAGYGEARAKHGPRHTMPAPLPKRLSMSENTRGLTGNGEERASG